MNGGRPTEVRLTLAPQRRFEAIDVNQRIAEVAGDVLVVTWRDILASHLDAGVVKLADARDSKSRDPYGS